MPASKNALLRYQTIDKCLCNRLREWTLQDLVGKCNEAMQEYCGTSVSVRSVQKDIEFMRSDSPGYGAPIMVYDRKYYTYADPDYSITKTPVSAQDLKKLNEAILILKQMAGFESFTGLEDVVCRLEDRAHSLDKAAASVVFFERNDQLRGLEYLPILYQAIVQKKVLRLQYHSFKARQPYTYLFSSYALKEFRNRWFVFGWHEKAKYVVNFALDRIESAEIVDNEVFIENDEFNPATYFNEFIGVTKLDGGVQTVRFEASRAEAPYIRTKPLHHSQRMVERKQDGSVIFEIDVIINQELIRELMGYAEGVKVLAPERLARTIRNKFLVGLNQYTP